MYQWNRRSFGTDAVSTVETMADGRLEKRHRGHSRRNARGEGAAGNGPGGGDRREGTRF